MMPDTIHLSALQRIVFDTLLACPHPMIIAEMSDGHYIACNQAYRDLTGWAESDIIGERMMSVPIWADGALHYRDRALQTLRQQKPYKDDAITMIRCANGQTRYGQVAIHEQIIDERPFLIYTIIDQSEFAEMQLEVSQQKQLYQQAFNHLPDVALMVYDEDLRFLLAENIQYVMPTMSPSKIVGKTVRDILSEDEYIRNEPYFRQALSGETAFVTQNRNGRTLALQFIPLHTWDIMRAMVFVRDISEREKMQDLAFAQVLEMERSQLLARFITNAMHEFLTPISIIQTNTYIMQRKALETPQRLEKLDQIRTQTENITQLVEKLVMMVRLDSVDTAPKTPFNLRDVLMAAQMRFEHRAQSEGLEFSVQCDEIPIQIEGDASHLRLALNEILDNAVRFTLRGGRVMCEVKSHNDNQVQITITDTGMGIKKDMQERVFERFYRQDQAQTMRGFGLGLPLVKRIVEQHHGTVRLSSIVAPSPQHGTQIILTLPLQQPPLASNNSMP
jgi:PAS domain S-box-containing protein